LSQFLKVTAPELYDDSLLGESRHKASKDILAKMIAEGKFVQDEKECFYLYGQTHEGRSQYGIVGCFHTDDYKNGLIKQHELTRVEKVSDRTEHIINTGFHTEPVFTAVRDNLDLDLIVQDCLLLDSLYSFVTSDSVSCQFWKIDNDAKIRNNIGRYLAITLITDSILI